MHLVGSITGCSDGGSVMLAAIASSAARMLASSLRCRERTYQANIPIAGNRYRTNRSGLMNNYLVVPAGIVAVMSNKTVGFRSQFWPCRAGYDRKQLSHQIPYINACDLTKSLLMRMTFNSGRARNAKMPCFFVRNRMRMHRLVRHVDEFLKVRDSSAGERRSNIG